MSSGKRVVVGMSGGVDSSVAAAILQQQGYDVIGVMLRLWSEPGKEGTNRCCTPDSMAQARRVAAQIGIPFYAVDVQDHFRKAVVQYFIDSSLAGSTPNPCILCNRHIRWGFLFEKAVQDFGAEYLATGHYARVISDSGGSYRLLKGIDPLKDQSYVLHQLTQENLAHTLLPLGGYKKSEIRELARQFNFAVADRPDSQDLCFLAGSDYREFLQRHAPDEILPGKIVDEDRKVLGEHQGLPFYTIGQRKGLGITTPEPYYVLDKKPEENLVVVGPTSRLGKRSLNLQNVNWIFGKPPADEFSAQVKIRYKAALADAQVYVRDGIVQVDLDNKLRDITPGQFGVLYSGDEVVGGGEIVNINPLREDA